MDEPNKEIPEEFIAYDETYPRKRGYVKGVGEVTMITSIYAEQDMHAYARLLFSRRSSGDITEQEIKDWQKAWEIIKEIKSWDFDEIKKKYKMQLIRDNDEYCHDYEELGDEVMLQGWLGDPINEENWQVMSLGDRLKLCCGESKNDFRK